MPGSIIQIANYSAQDIYLTGNPQITFFKIVYRRHSNFAIESIRQEFIGATNFGYEMSALIEKAGDLMHKIYLEIELPEVNLTKNHSDFNITHSIAYSQFTKIESYYKLFCEYVKINTQMIRQLRELLITDNITMDEIDCIMQNREYIEPLEKIRDELLCAKSDLNPHDIMRMDITVLYRMKFASGEKREELLRIINLQIYPEMQKLYLKIYQTYSESNRILSEWNSRCYSEQYAFAWVEEIGNAIIDRIDVKIGPEIIDRHTGDWMILNNKLMLNEYQKTNYYEMIGQVPQLIKFDSETKPKYKLIIPLLFWFCMRTGMSLPLVALRYHDVVLNLKLKQLSDLCYVENNEELPNIPEIQSKYNINIQNLVFYIDYIYLDSEERRRFAQSSHEYLIEVVQYNEFNIAPCESTTTHLDFCNPCRYMIFFCQPNQYRSNPTGRNKCVWNNFGTNSDKNGETVVNALIRLNSTNITDGSQPIIYFNYVQPYMYFNHSPGDGEYVYSFSLNPQDSQPNGTCNLSRINDASIQYKFTEEFIRLVNNNIYEYEGIKPGIYIATYVVSYNILRFVSGMAGLAFERAL